MGRGAVAVLFGGGMAVGLVAGAAIAAGAASSKGRDWFDVLDLALRLTTVGIFAAGLIGTFAVLTSLRAQAYSQMYARFQTVLLKLADRPDLFDRMKREEYTDWQDAPAATSEPHQFVANVLVNLYEEAFMLYEARVLSFIDTVPEDYWQSMLGSMRQAFRLRYVRTHWERRQAVFAPTFNRFVREQVLTDGE